MQNPLAIISLKRIRENAELVRRAAGTPLIAVVKDDGYGHGAERVSHALQGVAYSFAVSTADEGAALRCAGIDEDILVLTPPLCAEEALRIAEYNLTASITSFFVLKTAQAVVEKFGVPLRVHLAVNTGMNRYGFLPKKMGEVLKRTQNFNVEGIYSHLYMPSSQEDLRAQAALFEEAGERVKALYPNAVAHLGATGGLLAGVKTDAVRAGISLYGYMPKGFENTLGVKPAMKLYATVSHNGRTVGRGFGYGVMKEPVHKAHTLRIGYGDGLKGELCMDAWVRAGSGRTGRRKLLFKEVSEYARQGGISEYQALVSVMRRAEKRYEE